MRKTLLCAVLTAAMLLSLSMPTFAAVEYPVDAPYETYAYNSQNRPIVSPSAFTVERVLDGTTVGGEVFRELTDIARDDRYMYLCDAGTGRVVVADMEFSVQQIISSFSYEGREETLREPKGVCSANGRLYVADTGNSRIVIFREEDGAFTAERILNKPEIRALGGDYKYEPIRLTVDTVGRIYLIASGINQGLVCLDENGVFSAFLGAPQVQLNLLETLWRSVATKAQLEQMESYVPTEYDSLTVDSFGFLYVTSQTSNLVPVGKLNKNGTDVLTQPDGGFGDSAYLTEQNVTYQPNFVDLTLSGTGQYFLLDSKQGKIYAYSETGEMLYAFGANGTQQGTYYSASAIEYFPGDSVKDRGRLVVLDRSKGTVTVLRETAFSAGIRAALDSYDNGRYEEAAMRWEQVSVLSSGYVPAIRGLARIDIQNGDYRQAMKRLLPVRERELYASAFEKSREAFIRARFIWLILGAAGGVVLLLLLMRLLVRAKPLQAVRDTQLYKTYRYGTYVMFHPFDGFWDLKHEKRGSMPAAILIAALFFLFYALRVSFSGYVVTGTVTQDANVLYSAAALFFLLCFWVIANWCFITLMDGKGTLRDIIIATAYALKPYVLFSLPMLVLSHVLTLQESAFYQVLDKICILWMLILLFTGLMMTHDYSFSKSVGVSVLILVGICLIIFILLLLLHIVQEVYQFGYNIYQELSFRRY